MKKVIVILMLLSVFQTAFAQTEVNEDVLTSAEQQMTAEFLRIFEGEIAGDQTLIPNWLDGGRALVEQGPILDNIVEFESVLQEIAEFLNEGSKEIPEFMMKDLISLKTQIVVAIEALPFRYNGIKSNMRSHVEYLFDKEAQKLSNVKNRVAAISQDVQKLKAIYETSIQHVGIKFSTKDLFDVEVAVRIALLESLLHTMERNQVSGVELNQLVSDLYAGEGDMRLLYERISYKFSYRYQGVNMFKLFHEAVQKVVVDTAAIIGLSLSYSRSTSSHSSIDRRGYRQYTTQIQRTQYLDLALTERIVRLKAAIAKIK